MVSGQFNHTQASAKFIFTSYLEQGFGSSSSLSHRHRSRLGCCDDCQFVHVESYCVGINRFAEEETANERDETSFIES